MSTARKNAKNTQSQFLKDRFAKINRVIERLEDEVERAVEKFMTRSGKSSRGLRKNFEEIIGKISSSEIYSRASEKTEGLTKEVRRLADDVVGKVKDFDIRVANPLLQEIRGNIDQVVEKIQSSGIMELAKDKAYVARRQVLHALSIPSREEVSDLSRKVVYLEKKLKMISSKKAA